MDRMILIWVLAATVLLGYLRGGRLSNYLHAPLRGVLLPVLAFALEAAIPLWQRLFGDASNWLAAEVLAQYALLFLFCFLNRKHRMAAILIALAGGCNLAAMAANGFRMPVSPVIYDNALFEGFIVDVQSGWLCEYVLVEYGAPLWFLGDTIPVTILSPGVASVGDFLLAAGVLVLVQRLMLQTAPPQAGPSAPADP